MSVFLTLEIEVFGDIQVVTLNRPNAANALNTQMGLDLVSYFERASLLEVRLDCIVLTGAGDKAFCAGGDLKERDGMIAAAWENQHLIFERMARAIRDCPIPTIAAVNGAAYGGGCEIAALCDFVYASEQARFALPEASLGIIPGAGGTQTLPRAMGERRAKEILLSAQPFTAQEAATWGLVNRVTPHADLMESVLDVARRIGANAPLAVRRAKQAVHVGSQLSLADGMAFEIEAYNRLVSTDDRVEGIQARNEKRPPRFSGK
ncbi:enoyl-CoA hydratase-related protein [soil metagenome]